MKRSMTGLVAGGLLTTVLILGGVGAALAGKAPSTPTPGWGVMGNGTGSAGVGGMMGNGTGGSGGMMGGSNSGYGGMMGTCDPSTMMGSNGFGGMMGGWAQGSPIGKTITMDQAQKDVQQYIDRLSNKNLSIDEIIEFQQNYYAIVNDKSTGHGAFEVLVNKVTGAVFPEFGPAMMWNTAYGMMGHVSGYQQTSGPMTITPTKAEQIAQTWLATNQPGATTETADQFPGYYTVHFLKNGKVAGMLSINGYSEQVWYHTWHGAEIALREAQR